jgi:hypothetical protein
MTVFMDFVLKSGTPKATIVRQWKTKPEYSPATDYYRQLREAIVEYSSARRRSSAVLDNAVANASSKKQGNYREAKEGFMGWFNGHHGRWQVPPVSKWTAHDIEIRVAPELGFEVGDALIWVKLYFRNTSLKKTAADIMLELMASSLLTRKRSNESVVVLDVKNAREYSARGSRPALNAQLRAEAAYWAALWPEI